MASRTKRVVEAAGSGEIALILAAERLFAERGIEAVALRQVNQAANQKNMSAAHYHFGSKDGLVKAVLMHRWPTLDKKRGDMLLRASDRKDLRFFLEAFVAPLLDELKPRTQGNFYLRFMQQYERYRRDYSLARRLTPAGVEIYERIESLISYIPEEVRRLRVGYLINMIHSVLATAEERLGKREICYDDVELMTSNLIDMLTAGLTAPLSPETLERLIAR